jgi:tetratricopeptide (TPR) repeat protein
LAKGSMSSKRSANKGKKTSKPAGKKRSSGPVKAAAARKKRAPARPVRPSRPVRVGKPAEAEAKKAIPIKSLPEPSRLLRDTKATSAALGLLEKGIKLIFQKEFKKARIEFKTLIETYPVEAEILARARTYMQICDREQASHKKPVIATDQLYTLGVMEHNRGDYMNAVSYFRHSLEKNPKSDHIYYSLAASFAMKGDTAQALLNLQKAIELNEENRVYAKNDSDFTSLHGEKEFGELVGWSQPAASGQH